MGTRCGNIDANIIPYIMKKENLTPDQMTEIMNKKSGFGLSGKTSDLRDLKSMADEGDKRARMVIKKLVLDTVKNIGAYIAEMGGVDLIVFTAGIGENNPWLRRQICDYLGYVGVRIDNEANEAAPLRRRPHLRSGLRSQGCDDPPPTRELVIARDTMHIVSDQI